jgi:hypothetical protein
MTSNPLERQIDTLGWLHIVFNALFLAVGLGLFLLMAGLGIFNGDPRTATLFTFMGIFLAGAMSLLALPGIIAGYGLLKRRPWARMVAIVLGLLGLVNMPFGTALGIYTLWVLFQPDAAGIFEQERADLPL